MAVSSLMRKVLGRTNLPLLVRGSAKPVRDKASDHTPTLSQAELAHLFRAELRSKLAPVAEAEAQSRKHKAVEETVR